MIVASEASWDDVIFIRSCDIIFSFTFEFNNSCLEPSCGRFDSCCDKLTVMLREVFWIKRQSVQPAYMRAALLLESKHKGRVLWFCKLVILKGLPAEGVAQLTVCSQLYKKLNDLKVWTIIDAADTKYVQRVIGGWCVSMNLLFIGYCCCSSWWFLLTVFFFHRRIRIQCY